MALSPTELDELKKLRAENAKLKSENRRLEKMTSVSGRKKSASRNPRRLARKSGIIALVVISVALLTAGNLLFWFGNTIVKQDRFVAATEPIIKDPKVQQSMALYVTNNIFNNVDVQSILEQALPPRAVFLAPQLTAQLKSATNSTLQKALARPSFQEHWNNILATQHQRFIDFAAKYQGDGSISINDVYNQLDATLKNTKLSFLADKKLPAKVGSITVLNATWLPTAHKVVTHIDTWRLLTVIIFVLALALAVWLSRNRRRTIYTFGAFGAIFMLITLIAVRLTRETIADKVNPQYADGVRSAMQIFLHSLVIQTVTIFFALALLALVTWISGNSSGGLAVKKQIGLLFGGKLHTKLFKEENKFAEWVRLHKRPLEWGVVAIITALMLITRLTLKGLVVYAFLMLLAILGIEVVGGQSKDS